ncbi:hypothetical protein C8F04DRAFT_445707 [Mycena alexandri]|uniref:Uncharacterized protein n=1 Tax=Mycena alexandri TaxID=1745969 RepID=A0AAD6TGD2_9AGAR|nr:hypothetical protein C8F04DRAFT_445707 [Mycena alexandri]
MSIVRVLPIVLLVLGSHVLAGPVSARSNIVECVNERLKTTFTDTEVEAIRAGQMSLPRGVGQQQYNDIFDDCCKPSSTADSERHGEAAPNLGTSFPDANERKGPAAVPADPPKGPITPSVPAPDANEHKGPAAGPADPPKGPIIPSVPAPDADANERKGPAPGAPAPNPQVGHPNAAAPAPPAPKVDEHQLEVAVDANANQRQGPAVKVDAQEGPKDQKFTLNTGGSGANTHNPSNEHASNPNAVAGGAPSTAHGGSPNQHGLPIAEAVAHDSERTGGAEAKEGSGTPNHEVVVPVPDAMRLAGGEENKAPKTGFKQGEICICPS